MWMGFKAVSVWERALRRAIGGPDVVRPTTSLPARTTPPERGVDTISTFSTTPDRGSVAPRNPDRSTATS